LQVFKKAFLFGVIIAAIALYLRFSKKKPEWEVIGHEKTMA
jgi:hypothetical protein